MDFRDYYNSILEYLTEHPGETILDYDNPPGPKTRFIVLESGQEWFIGHLIIFRFINTIQNAELKERLLDGTVSVVATLNNRIPYDEIENWLINNDYHCLKFKHHN